MECNGRFGINITMLTKLTMMTPRTVRARVLR